MILEGCVQVPPQYLFGAMAMVLARLMGEMDLLVVVIGEPTMRLLDLLPADRLIEAG